MDKEKPSEDDWDQSGVTEHRLRNITPLVRNGSNTPEKDALAFEYQYISSDGSKTKALDTNDPRGVDKLIRCTPLVPHPDVQSD